MKKPLILVLTNNHFDPLWRRCWKKRFDFEGKTYVSYSELQDYYLEDNLKIAENVTDYKFEVESALVLREYLKKYPERKKEFVRLAKEKRFAVSGTGDNIIDSNMVLGESIIRNFASGLLWVEDTLRTKTELGVRHDAFGNSAQIPQIFRGCEIKWVTGFSYSVPDGDYFRGLDGTTVAAVSLPVASKASNAYIKYPPCKKCSGKGCSSCNNRGIEDMRLIPPEKLNIDKNAGPHLVILWPEEMLPCMEIGEWAAKMRKKYDVRFALESDSLEFLKEKIKRVDNPPRRSVHPEPELNPCNSGCWVTRIKLKQQCRRLEYAILNAETLSCMALLKGKSYPKEEFQDAWQTLLFTMFHDCITSTHIDPAYEELLEMNSKLAKQIPSLKDKALSTLAKPQTNTISLINVRATEYNGIAEIIVHSKKSAGLSLSGINGKNYRIISAEHIDGKNMKLRFLTGKIRPFSASHIKIKHSGTGKPSIRKIKQPVIENERFKISADNEGIVSIYDKKLKTNISQRSTYSPCEPILESDEGSPWSTLKNSRKRERASTRELISAESGPGYQALKIRYAFQQPTFAGIHPFETEIKVLLYKNIDRIDFESDVMQWDAFNGRIRFAFPIPFKGDDYYEIPYGVLKRKPYRPTFNWTGANGDWPAINWAGVQGKELSVALMNKGLPSYKIEDEKTNGKTLFLSVLRSPIIPTFLHEPKTSYVMTNFWGMRDSGPHYFEFALTAYKEPFSESSIVSDAETYNSGIITCRGKAELPEMPVIDSACGRISAVKMAEKGNALIIRVAEFRGKGGSAALSLPAAAEAVYKVNMLERNGSELEKSLDNTVKFTLSPWEIATIRIELAGKIR